MLLISPHVRAEFTLASHISNIRILPHPDHGRGSAPYLYTPIGNTHPEMVIRALERLIASGAITEPWSLFFMDHRRRLFHDVWLLPALPTHQSHCLYVATSAVPDELRLILDDMDPLSLTPILRHPILDLQNLDNTPLGILVKAKSAPQKQPASAPFDHFSEPTLSAWSDILHSRPHDETLGGDRRLLRPALPPTPQAWSMSSSPPTPLSSLSPGSYVDNTGPTPSLLQPASAWLSPSMPLRRDTLSPSSLSPWSPAGHASPPRGSGPPVTTVISAAPADPMTLLIDQVSALTQVVAMLASRLPPPPPPGSG